MDKIKQAISRGKDEPEDALNSAGRTGGQGSHFASAKQPGDTSTGSDPLVSSTAAPVPGTHTSSAQGNFKDTSGRQVGGQSHLGTSAPVDNTSTAAGSTSTYSTTHLRQGDPTSSVVDSRSRDPLTYKKPETYVHSGASEGSDLTASSNAHGTNQVRANEPTAQELRHGTDRIPGAFPTGEGTQEPLQGTGRTSGAYSTAEGTQAPRQGTERAPGAYSTTGYENPYHAQNLDPRVDNLPRRAKDETDHSASSHTTGSTAAGIGGAGLATAGAAHAISRHDDTHQSSATAPSDQTSTVRPTDRSANYSQAERTKFQEDPATTTSISRDATGQSYSQAEKAKHQEDPTSTASLSKDATGQSEKSPSMLGKVLGAVGFSDLAGVGTGAPVKSDQGPALGPSGAPLTTSETDSSKSPSQSGQKETTAATAYQSGSDSAKPISPSAGGTRYAEGADTKTQGDRHLGRDVAAGAGLVGAAGAGALGAHEYKKSSAHPEDATRQSSSVPTSTGTATGPTSQQYEDRTHPGLSTSSHQATTIPESTKATGQEKSFSSRQEDDHSRRNVTGAAAAGLGAAGAGAYGAHELKEREAAKKASEYGTESAHQQKEIEKQQAARAKQAEKEEKAHRKELEKEEKAHHKELEKQEKAAAKEHEKSEKKATAAYAAAEKERQREAKDKKGGHEDTLAAAGVGAGVAGAGAAAYGASKEDEKRTSQDGEKKPGLLKRIFKRKNKDTGEEEEYEAEEEETDDSHHHKGTAALGAAGVGAAGAGLASHAAGRDKETGASHLKSAEDRAIAQPSTTQSSTAHPSTKQSSTAQPYATQSSTVHPSTTEYSTAHPSTTQKSTTQSSAGYPPTTQQSATESSTKQHSTVQPSTLGAAGIGAAGAGLTGYAIHRDQQKGASHLQGAEDPSIAHPSTTHSSTGYTSTQQPSTVQSSTGYQSAQQPYTAQSSDTHPSTAQPHTQSPTTHHPSALGAAGVGAAGAGLAGYAVGRDKETGPTQSSSTYHSTHPSAAQPHTQSSTTYPATAQSSTAYPSTTQTSTTTHPSSTQATGQQQYTTAYEDKSGGYSKPSYNPFSKGDPASTRTTDTERVGQSGQTGKTLPSEGRYGTEPTSARGAATTTATTGAGIGTGTGTATASDPSSTVGANERSSAELDKHQRNRLHKDPPAGHPAALASAERKEYNTGSPHDYSSKYSETAAARQEGHQHHQHQHHDRHHDGGLGTSDEVEGEEHKGLKEKIKEKLGLGHHDTHEER